MITRGAGAIIHDPINDKLLIVRGKEKYSLPKGHQNPGETAVSCALREIREETGLMLTCIQDNPVTMIIHDYIYYYIPIINGSYILPNPIDTNEIVFSCWVSINSINQLNQECNQGLKYIIKHWESLMELVNKSKTKLLKNS